MSGKVNGKVAVLKTSPETVVQDYGKLMEMAEFRRFLPKDKQTLLKINISWHVYFPACSTTPWQLEGVTKKLRESGYKKIIGAHNSTVVVDARVGEKNNHLSSALKKYKVDTIHLTDPGVEYVDYTPKKGYLVLDKVYPNGVKIPKFLIGKNIVHLPTMKTHVFTEVTGAMKNAFGGLLHYERHWTHSVINETLVDLLEIQKEIHTGLFAVMDGTIAGSGPGPRAMIPHVKNYILASADQVAIDAISAKMQGFDPMKLKFIKLAHDRGLGCGDVDQIDIVGEDISKVNFGFKRGETFASRGQKAIYHGPLKPFEKLLLRTWLVPWSYVASRMYHDAYWLRFIGKKRIDSIMKTKWGELFQKYG